MRATGLGLALIVSLSSAAHAQTPGRSFDVFDDEQDEDDPLPAGDEEGADVEEPEPEPAPSGPRLVVLVLTDDLRHAGAALRISRATTAQLARAQGMEPADVIKLLDPDAARVTRDEMRDGLASVRRAEKALEALELDTAAVEADIAVAALLGQIDRLGASQREALDRALFAMGTTALFQGQGTVADSVFVALAQLSPSFVPDRDRLPDNVVERYGLVKASLHERPTGRMHITSNPPGAAVWVDGEFRGSTPVDVESLIDGQHAVVIERTSYRAYGTLCQVTGGRTARLDLDLERTGATSVVDNLSTGITIDAERAMEVGRRLGVTRLAALWLDSSLSGDRISGLWLDVAAGKTLATVPSTEIVEEPDVASATIVGAIAAAIGAKNAPPAGPQTSLTEPGPSAATPGLEFMNEWWFWAAVGGAVAVAAASTAVVVAATDDGPGRPPNGLIPFGF